MRLIDADEIVRALRICNRPKGHRCSECPIFSRYEHRTCKATVDKDAADLIEALQAQLAASQRRADAAVEDIMCRDHCDVCKYSKYDGTCDESDFDCQTCKNACPCATCRNEDKWEWRGPQETGKGETK